MMLQGSTTLHFLVSHKENFYKRLKVNESNQTYLKYSFLNLIFAWDMKT